MDQATSQRGSHENSDLEPDLPGFPTDMLDRSQEDVSPSRPSSRLSFNRTILSTSPLKASPDQNTLQWSHSLFQNVGISDLRLHSTKPQSPTKAGMVGPPPPGCQVESVTNEALFPSRDQNSTSSDCGKGSNAFARSQVVPRKSPKSSAPSVSRLCFPFVTTSSPRRNKPPPSPPPPRHKYSCFPTLMSPVSPGRPAPRHQRHNYRQHGYSRLALVQVKWFWSLREEELQGHDLQARSTAAEGEAPPDGNVPLSPPIRPSSTGSGNSPISNPLDVATVHPRFGDLKALRDPYCVRVDEYFINLPPWTIRKIIWMFDLFQASEKQSPPQIAWEEDASDAEYESELESSSASTTYGDDSDTTLVESESEADLVQMLTSTSKTQSQAKIDNDARYAGPSSIDFSALRTILENGNWRQPKKYYSSKSHFVVNTKPSRWATNWDQRWAILTELSRLNQDRADNSCNLKSSYFRPSTSTKSDMSGRRFFLAANTPDSDDEDA